MTQTIAISAEILTHDTEWATKFGQPGRNGRTAITVDAYECLTFGPKHAQMVRFNLGRNIPSDWGNPIAMIPRSHTSLPPVATD